jgi:hypothetical protein
MRLLLISYYYAPLVSPRAFRWTAIASRWAAQGHDVTVVAAWKPGLKRREIIDGVRVERVGSSVAAALRARLTSGGGAKVASAAIAPAGWRGALRWAYDRTWKRMYWPDFAWAWYLPALRSATRLWRAQEFDGLVSISDPFTGQFVGWRLARRFDIANWVADVGDPFCFLYRDLVRGPQLLKRLDAACERRIYARAKAIAYTTEGTCERYANLFPASAGKMCVIPPLAPPLPEAPAEDRVFPADGRIRLVYAGSFYAGIRTPAPLLRLLDQLSETPLGPRVEMHIFGNAAGYEALWEGREDLINRKIFLHGVSPRDRVLQACREADAIINLGNRTRFQVPSKVVEYIQLGRPIVNLTTIAEDSSAIFLHGYPLAISVAAEAPICAEALEQVQRFLLNPPRLTVDLAASWMSRFRPDVIAREYERLLTNPHDYNYRTAAA